MSMNSTISRIVGVVVVLAAAGLVFFGSKSNYKATPTDSVTASQVVTATSTYSLQEVSKHNSANSCWTTINSGVYDVTSWINRHPGGPEAILSLCGKDG